MRKIPSASILPVTSLKADSVLGIVAVGYTAVGSRQGWGDPKSFRMAQLMGLSLGSHLVSRCSSGKPDCQPLRPSGAVISQQIGIATETGIAVNCGDGVAYL